MSKFLLEVSKRIVCAPFCGQLSATRSKATYKPYLTLGERLTATPSALCASTGSGGCWGNDPVDGKPRPPKKDKSNTKSKKHSNKKKKRKSKTKLSEKLEECTGGHCGNKFADVKCSVTDSCASKKDVCDKNATTDCKVDGKKPCATNTSVSEDASKAEVSKDISTDVKMDEKEKCAKVCNKQSSDNKMDVCYTQSADSVCDQTSTDTNVVCKHKSDDAKVDVCYTQSADCVCDENRQSSESAAEDSNKKSSDHKMEDSSKQSSDHKMEDFSKKSSQSKVEDCIKEFDDTFNCCYKKCDEESKDSKEVKSSAKKATEEECSCSNAFIARSKTESNEMPSPMLFREMEEGELGPDISKTGTYQNPEYFSYTKWSFYDAMIGIARVSCPQPSNKLKYK